MSKICHLYENKLPELRELTKRLTFGDISTGPATNYKQITVEKGHAYIVGLSSSADYSVAFNYASAGTPFPQHEHPHWEYLIVIKGKMEITITDKDDVERYVTLPTYGFVEVDPESQHSAYFPEDTTFLAITVPAEEDFPKVDS